MKKALVVFAHPEPHSMNGQLKDKLISCLESKGYTVLTTDLYSDRFKTTIDRSDFPFWQGETMDISRCQTLSVERQEYPEDVRREMEKLLQADLIVLQFPMWWHSCPSIMHAYFERVFLPGWAYFTENPALRGKKVLVCTTTSGTREEYTPDKRGTIYQVLHHLLVGTLLACGMNVLEPLVLYGLTAVSNEERAEMIKQFETDLRNVDNRSVAALNFRPQLY